MTKPDKIVEILNNCPFKLSDQMKIILKDNRAPAVFSCCINQFNKNFKIIKAAVAKSDFDYKTLFIIVDNDSINWPIEFQFRSIDNKFLLLNAIELHDLLDGECIDSMKSILGIKEEPTNEIKREYSEGEILKLKDSAEALFR